MSEKEKMINEGSLSISQLLLLRQMQRDGRSFYKHPQFGFYFWRVGHGNINTSTANALIKKGVVILKDGEYILSDRISHFLPSQLTPHP